jgi:hypothetical protein
MCLRNRRSDDARLAGAETLSSCATTNDDVTTLSPRAIFMMDYINGITLSGQTLMYHGDFTPENRALAWLIEDQEEGVDEKDDTVQTTTQLNSTKISHRRSANAMRWFQSPNYFDDGPLGSADRMWGIRSLECDWCDDDDDDDRMVVTSFAAGRIGRDGSHS